MSRLKVLSVLAGTIAMLALSATSASATWTSNTGQTTGNITVNSAGEFTYPTGHKIKCNAAEIKAQWQIQGAGQIKEQQQKITTSGPHLQVQVKNWGANCIADGMLKAEVSECDFQLVQQAGSFTATAGVSKRACVIKIEGGACAIQVPVGMEAPQGSGKGINVGLKGVTLTNSGTNQIDKATINSGGQGQRAGEGIFATASGPSCGLFTIVSATEESTLTGLEFTAEGVKAV
jgi:hypothetical protein